MKLQELTEDFDANRFKKMLYQNQPEQSQHNDNPPQGPEENVEKAVRSRLKQKSKRHRAKVDEFYIRFQPEFGGGYYKVRVKRVGDQGELQFNYGYFDRSHLPDTKIDSNKLTDEGQRELRKLKDFMRKHNVIGKRPSSFEKRKDAQSEY